VLNSQDIVIIGAGLYSFFNSYSTTCSDANQSENCQSLIFSVEGSSTSDLYVYGLTTVGTTDMIVIDGTAMASYSDNVDVFGDTIAYFTYNTGS
jgi:hypothetical protein